MEPLVQYSQRDPLYHSYQKLQNSDSTTKDQLAQRDTVKSYENFVPERDAIKRDDYEVGSYYPPPYYTQPEPIIEIIIKESNVTLPTTPPPPPRPVTKEPIHVFYVKYKKNPNPKGKDDQIIYDPPIPALVPHSSEIHTGDDNQQQKAVDSASYIPISTTTLRTIIRPESETYHGSRIKVTFNNPEETELKEGTEQRPRVVLPPDSRFPNGNIFPAYRPESVTSNDAFSRTHSQGVGRPPPIQVFNSQSPQGHLHPPETLSLGPLRESSYQSSRFTLPTDEQIRQYQQEKLYLYQESLKQQNARLPPSISPIVPPQRFQQPTNNPPSQLQIDFNNQKQQLRVQNQDTPHGHQQHELKKTNLNYPFLEPAHHQQTPSFLSDYQTNKYDKNHESHKNAQLLSTKTSRPDHRANFNSNQNTFSNENYSPSQFHNPANKPPTIPGFESGIQQQSIQPGISVFEQTIVSHETQQDKPYNNQSPSTTNIHPSSQEKKYEQYFSDGEIIKSVAQSEEHQVTPDYRNEFYSALREPPKRQKLPLSNDPLQLYPVYSTTPSIIHKQFAPKISTTGQITRSTAVPILSSTTPKSIIYENKGTEKYRTALKYSANSDNKTALNANLAALPAEVPEDLRAQLISSGILSSADIQILDYDKVGDIPIESLPPEHLEHFHGAGSDPVPSVIKPETESSSIKIINPYTEKSQKGAKSFFKKNQSQTETKSLKSNKYNRYLPLKVNGTQFILTNTSQLKGRTINSVVVLAPVDYDFIGEKDGEVRVGKAIQVEGVRFIAGKALKDLVKNPTRENYSKWLEQEKNTPARYQSVILLIARKEEQNSKNSPEIYMYDVNSATTSKLRGELSQTFVEVAESNSYSQDIDGIDSSQ